MRSPDQEPGERRGVAAVDQAPAAHERVEVVELHPGEAVGRAPVDPAADDPGQLAPLLPRADVEQPLSPRLVDDRLAAALEHQPPVLAPEPALVRLGLEPVDVADVVAAGGRRGPAVADHDADVAGQRSGAAELVVEVRADRRRLRSGVRRSGERPEEQEYEQRDPPSRHAAILAAITVARDAGDLQTPLMHPPRLDVSADDFGRLAERVVGEAKDYLERLDESPIRPASSGAETVELFSGPLPEEGLGAAALDDLRAVADHSRTGNGRFFGYVMGSGEPVAALGDLFASRDQPERHRVAVRSRDRRHRAHRRRAGSPRRSAARGSPASSPVAAPWRT